MTTIRLTRLQAKVLREIRAHPDTTVSRLAQTLRHRPYYLLNTVDALVAFKRVLRGEHAGGPYYQPLRASEERNQ